MFIIITFVLCVAFFPVSVSLHIMGESSICYIIKKVWTIYYIYSNSDYECCLTIERQTQTVIVYSNYPCYM